MPCLLKNSKILIIGQSGTGKTTLAKQLINKLRRAIILDSDFEEFDAEHFHDVNELYKYLEDYGAADDFRVSYTPLDEEHQLMYDWARIVGGHKEITLVLEECDRFPVKESIRGFKSLMRRGRHWGLNIIGITTDVVGMNISFRRQATEMYIFRVTEPADLEWLRETMSQEIIDQIRVLPDYEYIKFNNETKESQTGKTKAD